MKNFLSLASALAFVTSVHAQSLVPIGSVDPAVSTLSSVLGYELGERFTDFRLLERVTESLASHSQRVRLVTYGASVEHRPLRALIITSPENHARLDWIRAENLKLTDPRTLTSDEADRIARDLPAIVWISAGVHGNESSSPEAALALAYQLAAGTDERTRAIVQDAVVIIDPTLNPDGRERYVRWYHGTATVPPTEGWDGAEHAEPWPGGRTNHYGFDLNRDWAWLTQKESRDRVEFYRTWMPHTHVDLHEMGPFSSYFFFPAAVPFHESLPPDVARWGKIYGAANAAALDLLGAPYYVGENFDMFYPGYGDSWPTFNGAIGMTYEQAGSGRAGLTIRRTDGTRLTLRERIRNHFTTSLATIETTVRKRTDRVRDFAAYWRSALDVPGSTRTIFIRTDRDRPMGDRLADVLTRNGIEVHQLASPATFSARAYYSPRNERVSFPTGTLAIRLDQPQRRLATALLEAKTAARDTFFYDVSAWSLPVAYGLSAYESEVPLPSTVRRWSDATRSQGRIVGDSGGIAYLIPWESHAAARMVWSLLRHGRVIHAATRSFVLGGKTYGAGTAVIFAGSNRSDLRADINEAARRCGIDVFVAATGLTEKGIALGSDRVVPVRAPSVALATDEPTSPNDVGEIWHLLENEFESPPTLLRTEDLGRAVLSKYDVIILPDGWTWKSALDSTTVAALRLWVSGGGVLISIDDAARAMTKSTTGLTSSLLLQDTKEDEKSKEEKEREKGLKERRRSMTRFQKEEFDRRERIPGTIFRIVVDTTHPTGFGLPGEMFAFKGNGAPFKAVDQGHVVVRFSPDTTQVSGYSPRTRAKEVAGAPYLQEFQIGRGKVYLFSESPTFRSLWQGTTRFLVNAMLFGPPPRTY